MAVKRGIQLKSSEHAKQRIKERIGVEGKREVKELVKNAYHRGISLKRNYVPQITLNWIKRKVNKNYFGRCSNWTIYKGHLFLFSKSLTLVTVIEVPSNLVPKKELPKW